MDDGMDDNNTDSGRWKWWAILAVLITLLIFIGIGYGLYQLGGADQAPLERLRDIAIIFLIFQLLLVTIILGGLAAGLVFLIIVLKDQVIPLLTELTETAKRLRGTTEFITEEAVKPIIKSAGQAAKWRATVRAITGQDRARH
jgi:polyferredoxin